MQKKLMNFQLQQNIEMYVMGRALLLDPQNLHNTKIKSIIIRGVSELRIRIRIRGYPHEF